MTVDTDFRTKVQEYYGRVLSGTRDLKTGACCSPDRLPAVLREILTEIHPEIVERFYGCDSPIPPAIEGRVVLDLGCGTGRDVYLCSKLVGERGSVIGVDMTGEQLEIARRHEEDQRKRFGHEKSNVRFLHGYIEDVKSLGIEDESVDAVISNCVINLSPDKNRVFSEILRVLKPGGEIYFSDVFSDRRLPAKWREDPVLVGECLAGAMYTEDFRRLMLRLGVPDYRVVSSHRITLDNPEIDAKIGMARFYSLTVRAFKLESLEDRCEDYGQVAYYRGTIRESPHSFVLDDHHEFFTGKPMLVCGNTAAMLSETRFAEHFRVEGNRSVHYGLFDCGSGGSEEVSCCGNSGTPH